MIRDAQAHVAIIGGAPARGAGLGLG